VAVKDICEILVGVIRASAPWASPRIVTSTLKLGEKVGLGWGIFGPVVEILLNLERDVWSIGSSALIQVAAPTRRVRIDTMNVNITLGSRRVVHRPRVGVLEILIFVC
jgi:hypothetical protein